MKKKQGINASIGSSTMLLIFVVISLVSFAVLSLSSAITDKKFTDKIKQKNLSYYEACNQAESQLQKLDQMLLETYSSTTTEEEYFQSAAKGTTIIIPVSDYQELHVDVSYLYPKKEGDAFYAIDTYSLVSINTPEPDESLLLLQ